MPTDPTKRLYVVLKWRTDGIVEVPYQVSDDGRYAYTSDYTGPITIGLHVFLDYDSALEEVSELANRAIYKLEKKIRETQLKLEKMREKRPFAVIKTRQQALPFAVSADEKATL